VVQETSRERASSVLVVLKRNLLAHQRSSGGFSSYLSQKFPVKLVSRSEALKVWQLSFLSSGKGS
jgi:hypothetical protein